MVEASYLKLPAELEARLSARQAEYDAQDPSPDGMMKGEAIAAFEGEQVELARLISLHLAERADVECDLGSMILLFRHGCCMQVFRPPATAF
jgi:hypothetical protein